MMDHDYSGTTLDEQYRVDSIIGKGSMGTVYLGQNLNTGIQVAIKILHASLLEREDSIKRFFREAQAAVEISHKNIINVIDVGLSTFDEPYIVMEYLQGETLADMLKRVGRVDLPTAKRILEPLLLALNAIHEKGIVHRDIKPEKIFLVRRQTGTPLVKLVDFGLSKFTESSAATMLTVAGTVIGDVAYISPEQARGDKNVDRRTDIYAVGMILYRILAGRLPFDSEKYHEILIAKMSGKLKPPQEAYSGFPAEAIALVTACLSKDPIERPQNGIEMLQGLRALHSSTPAGNAQLKQGAGGAGGRISGSFSDGKNTDEIKRPVSKKKQNLLAKFTSAWRQRSKTLFIGLGATVAVLLILIIVAVVSSSGNEQDNGDANNAALADQAAAANPETAQTASPEAASAAALAPEDVQIELRGLPSGAKIFFDGASVPVNPFRVTLREVIIPLKVEAEGFEPYSTHLVPSEDQVVRVEMKPLNESAEETDPDESAGTPSGLEGSSAGMQQDPGASGSTAPTEPSRPTDSRKASGKKKKSRRSSKKKSGKFMHEFD